jgi:hypothetical protein
MSLQPVPGMPIASKTTGIMYYNQVNFVVVDETNNQRHAISIIIAIVASKQGMILDLAFRIWWDILCPQDASI